MDATIVGCERGQCGEAFCSVNPTVSERQSGSNGWWRSRCDCLERKAEMMHTKGKFGWRGREEGRREEKRGRGDKSLDDWLACRWWCLGRRKRKPQDRSGRSRTIQQRRERASRKKKKRLRENGVYGDAPAPTGKWSELTRNLASRRMSKKRQIKQKKGKGGKKKKEGRKNRFYVG